MSGGKKDILHQDLEIPEIVWEKADAAFSQIYKEAEEQRTRMETEEQRMHKEAEGQRMHKEAEGQRTRMETEERRKPAAGRRARGCRLPRIAAAAIFACLILGGTAAAMGAVSLYRERMEAVERPEMEALYQVAEAGETDSLNRPFTEEERARRQELAEEYEKEGRFPEGPMAVIPDGDSYTGQGVAVDASTRTLYLPEGTLSDEELLQVIDYQHKVAYSIYEKNQERILAQGNWESRVAAMTDEEVDRIYLAYCASNQETGGGYSRELTQSERDRYEELRARYENEGIYPERELPIIQTKEEYTGTGAAFCEENSTYCIPDGECSDVELLQIIDFEHKLSYCFDRIAYEVQMGLREGYPRAE